MEDFTSEKQDREARIKARRARIEQRKREKDEEGNPKRVADGDGQSWSYNSVSNTIEFGHSGTSGLCLIVNTTTQVLELDSCDLTEARWSQYSECRLNTREKTGAMRLERFSDSGSMCLNDAGSDVMVSSC